MKDNDNKPQKGTIVTLQLPADAAKRLREGFEKRDPKLMEICKELRITEIKEASHQPPSRT